MTVMFSPVTKMTWIGMCFLDLTAWEQMKTQSLSSRYPWAQWPVPEAGPLSPSLPKVLAIRYGCCTDGPCGAKARLP